MGSQGWRFGLRRKVDKGSPTKGVRHDWDESPASPEDIHRLNAYLDFIGSRKAEFGLGRGQK